LVPFLLFPFQERLIREFQRNRFAILKCGRQLGKSTMLMAYFLHCSIFNEDYAIAIAAHKQIAANGLLGRFQKAYENLPLWMQSGVVEWNKGSVVLENGSKIGAFATSADGLRSFSCDMVVLDEFAFVPNNIAEEFFTSTYPVISAGDNTKILITSTPKGLNHFYEKWLAATEPDPAKRSEFVPLEAHWSEWPGRDENWRLKTISNTSLEQFQQEHEADFLGSSATLISATKMKQLMRLIEQPKTKDFGEKMFIYDLPLPEHTYVISVDVSEGLDQDFSAFSVIDVTELPYKQVAKYRNNGIQPFEFPAVILTAGRAYNDAFVLIEINSIGLQVADIMHFELEYENLIKIELKNKQQMHTPGFKKRINMGLKQSVQTKQIGCNNLKSLIENDKLIVRDTHTVKELANFVVDKKTYKAEVGYNDDLAMTLVNFGWLTSQRYFREDVQSKIRTVLQEENTRIMDADILPTPIMHTDQQDGTFRDAVDLWFEEGSGKYPWDDFTFDPFAKL
jgi:predicted nucleic-acid-binding protein